MNRLHKSEIKTNENGRLTATGDWRKDASGTSSSALQTWDTRRRGAGDEGNDEVTEGTKGVEVRRPSSIQGVPATMEAVVRMEVEVGDCGMENGI